MHKVNGLNDALDIQVLDGPGPGGASHIYRIVANSVDTLIKFQTGPINEVGVNGISNEALLAIVQDRLEGFQAGEYGCFENEVALDLIRVAIGMLHHRTRKRVERGVEGTSIV